MKETLGERIRKARLLYGMSQTELAKRVGISKTAMNQIEMGETDPRASRIAAIAETLHVSTDYLLLGRQSEDIRGTSAGRGADLDGGVVTPSQPQKRPRTRKAASVA
jgi:transcriptional regulator with XRE-family HTH domain